MKSKLLGKNFFGILKASYLSRRPLPWRDLAEICWGQLVDSSRKLNCQIRSEFWLTYPWIFGTMKVSTVSYKGEYFEIGGVSKAMSVKKFRDLVTDVTNAMQCGLWIRNNNPFSFGGKMFNDNCDLCDFK